MLRGQKQFARFAGKTCVAVILLLTPIPSIAKDGAKASRGIENAKREPAALWVNPTDIASRNLFYGPGGKEDQPPTKFTFMDEDLHGTNPKFDVRDENGVKWRVKLGPEARPETVASRLLWAVGYSANEDYFVSDLHVDQMRPLKRGQKLVGPDGSVHDVRLKRYSTDDKKVGDWSWKQNPFTGTRELNGLRVMMALMNNWDLKNINNSIYKETNGDGLDPVYQYVVSDLGASFGTTGLKIPIKDAKGNLSAYSRSKFILRINSQYVDFAVPSRASLLCLADPKQYDMRLHLRWIGQHIPRADARWMGQLLSQLSADQIRDAFRAAGYSPSEVDQFADVVMKRIAELQQL
jgi:hypothetical protein